MPGTPHGGRVPAVSRPSWLQLQTREPPALGVELRLLLEALGAMANAAPSRPAMVLPSNMLVGADGRVLFGPTNREGLEAHKHYVPPEASVDEVLEKGGSVALAVYSIGALLFEAVAGVPFESPESIDQELASARIAAEAAGLGSKYWELRLLEIAAKATRFDPSQRWSSAAAFAAALRHAAAEHVAPRELLAEYAARHSSEAAHEPSSSEVPENETAGPLATTVHQGGASSTNPGMVGTSAPGAPVVSKQTLLGIGAVAMGAETPTASATQDPHQTLPGVGAPPQSAVEHAQPTEEDGVRDGWQTLPGVGTPADVLEDEPAEAMDHESIAFGSDEQPVRAIAASRSRSRVGSVRVFAALSMVVAGAALPVAYYEGYLEWAGLDAPARTRATIGAPETSIEGARAEVQEAQAIDVPFGSASAAPLASEADEVKGVHPDSSAPPCDTCEEQDERQSTRRPGLQSAPAGSAEPAATGRPVRASHRRPQPGQPKTPAVRDYGI